MIRNKEDLSYYLEEDKKQLGININHPILFCNDVWKFQIALRKYEYFMNVYPKVPKYKIFLRILKKISYLKYHYYSIRLGFDIPINVFGPGLNIHHYGCIVVNSNARVGKNCNLQQCTTIGMNKNNKAATIGDNVFIGTGAKIIGEVTIADNCIIGANSVVTKDFLEKNCVIAGVPAKVIKNFKI